MNDDVAFAEHDALGLARDLRDLQRLKPLEDFQPQERFDQRVHSHGGTNLESNIWRVCGSTTQFALDRNARLDVEARLIRGGPASPCGRRVETLCATGLEVG